ncbi:MAG: hypothetical protein ACOVJ8_01395, partial [Sediminibacterium sp.]
MDTKEIMDAIELASKGLKEGVDNAKSQAAEALQKAADMIAKLAEMPSMDSVKAEIEAAKKELQTQHDALSTKMNKQSASTVKAKTFTEAFTEAYMAKADEIKSIIKNDGKQDGPLVFDIKSAVTIGDFNT